MPDFSSFINEILWGSVMIYLLLGTGCWPTQRTGFVQFRYIRQLNKSLKNSISPQPGGLTSFQVLCTSLAACVGSGDLADVMLAVTAGGARAIFWMWISTVTDMATSFTECFLAQLYRERDNRGRLRGGPAWYMARGLGMRWMGVLLVISLLIVYGLIFNSVQANSVSHALTSAFDIPPLFSGTALAIVSLLVIVGGIKGVIRLMQWFVPMMALLWIGCSLVICLWHFGQLPGIIMTIIKSAFGRQEATASTAGHMLNQAITSGSQRGMSSNEAEMGSIPNAAASAASWPPYPAAQGIVRTIGVLGDTLILCTASAMIILPAGNGTTYVPMEGIQLLQRAMVSLTGEWGAGFVALIVILFAFSSTIANYIYAENNLIFLKLDNIWVIRLLRVATICIVIDGTLTSFPLVWQLTDIIMACMTITNLTAILLPSPVIHTIANDYLHQRKLRVRPEFDPRRYPDTRQQLTPGDWDETPCEQRGNRSHQSIQSFFLLKSQ